MDFRFGKALLQLADALPMRGAFAAIEKSGFAEHERPSAHRTDVGTGRSGLADEAFHRGRDVHLAQRETRNDDRVFLLRRGERLEAAHFESLRSAHSWRGGAVLNPVRRTAGIRFMECLQRPGDVEDLAAGEERENYPACANWRTPFSSASSCATVAMRAKRPRSAYSVRSMTASTPSSSPGVSRLAIGNVSVASVTKSTA